MGTVCFQCAMEALARGAYPPEFDETPDEHLQRVHPHGVDLKERLALEQQVANRIKAEGGREQFFDTLKDERKS